MHIDSLEELSVLLVEPSSVQQKFIADYLSRSGVTNIAFVTTAKQAIDNMTKYPPDLTISAMHLADMTGTELVKTMRETKELHDIPYMLISSETDYRYLEPIRQAGTIAILPKPFSQEQLDAALNSTMAYINPGELDTSEINGEDLNVLLVDDSSTARKHIGRVLRNMGIKSITEAINGKQALEKLKLQYFDLVVTDYNMPEMDGRELVDNIRNNSNQSTIPILMVSSEAEDSRLAAVQQLGVSAICDKPFDSITVKQLLENIL